MSNGKALVIVLRNFVISLLFMFLGFVFGKAFLPKEFIGMAKMLLVFLGIFFLVICMLSRKSIIPRRFSAFGVYVFTFIDGILMYPILEYYFRDLGIGLFISVFLGAITMFSILAFIGFKKEAGSFLGFGRILFAGLIGLLVLSLFNLFIRSETIYLLYSVVSLFIFSGYVLYDINNIKIDLQNGYIRDEKDLSIYVLDIYLEFINILLDFLRIASRLDD